MRQLPIEFLDVGLVLDMGAKKYGEDSWLHGIHFNHKDNCASIFRHLAEVYTHQTVDHESGLHPALHAAARLLMHYTLWKRGNTVELTEQQYIKLQEYLASKPLPNKELQAAFKTCSDILDSIKNES